MPAPGSVGIGRASTDAERYGHGRLVLVAERDRRAQVQEPGEPQRFRLLERPRVKVSDEIYTVVETLERVARPVEDSRRVVEPLVEKVAPGHQAKLAVQADVGCEYRPLGSRQPVIRDRILVVGERREEAAKAELETVVEVQVDEGVQQVETAPRPPVDRELVLDRLGDVAGEEDSLARQEETAIGRGLSGLGPDPSFNLRFVVNPEPELLVLGLELESRAEAPIQRQPLGAGDIRRRVSWRGRERGELPLCIIRHGGVEVGRRGAVPGPRRSAEADAVPTWPSFG